MGSERRPAAGCAFLGSPCWPPLHRPAHSSFHPLARDDADADAEAGRSRRWLGLLRRLAREAKSKPPSFRYDVASYYKNFDDGCGWDCPSSPPSASSQLRASVLRPSRDASQ